VTLRFAGWALLGLAAAVYGGLAAPLRTKLVAARAELAAARTRSASRSAPDDIRSAEMARVVSRLLRLRARASDPVLSARKSALAAVPGPGVKVVSLSVRAARAPLAAAATVSAEGQLADLCRMVARLTRDGEGLVLERATFTSGSAGVQVRIEAQAVASDPAAATVQAPSEPLAPPRPGPRSFPRDPFRYLEEGTASASGAPGPRGSSADKVEGGGPRDTVAEAPAQPVRLVGLVRQAGTLKAALSVGGQVAVVAAGESHLGFRVVTIDADRGVRVEGPDGFDAVLPVDPE
jgi:hypothetical protein